MAAPNIASTSPTITGELARLAVTTSATDIISAVTTNHVYKVNSLLVSNIDGVNTCWVTADHYRSAAAMRFAYQIPIPAGVTLELLSRSIYLEEGDALRLTAQNNSDLEAIASYEDIS